MGKREWPRLYCKTSTAKINFWEIWTLKNKIYTKWGQIDGDSITNAVGVEGKNIGRSNETTPAEQAVKEAKSKWEKKKKRKYFETLKDAETKLNIKPMLAKKLDDKRIAKLTFPVDCQPKLDGVRCMAYNLPGGNVRLMSRGGEDYSLPHIQTALKGKIPKGYCLDGELYAHGVALQTIRHLVETYSDDSLQVELHVYDFTKIPADKSTWNDRHENQLSWFDKHHKTKYIQYVTTQTAKNSTEIKKYHDMWVEEGYEGLILRTHTGVYKLAGRSGDLLKLKAFEDKEFEVIGFKKGRDGYPVFICLQEDGEEVEAKPKGNAEARTQLMKIAKTKIGQLLTVRYCGRTLDNIPLFPVGISFRPAKDL